MPHLSSSALVELCHRLAIELDAGIDVRRVWQREADGAPRRFQAQFARVRDAVARGDSLAVALAGTRSIFPRLFLEMVHVGEQTGTLPEVFRRLERHYKHQVDMRRTFLGLIAWPMIQLGIAIFVIGLMILILGMIDGPDVLGFGLVGTGGLIIYANFIIAVALCGAGLVMAFRRGMVWTKPVERMAMQSPVLGSALQKICLARLAWAMHLTLNVEMDLRRLIPLSLRATGSEYFIQQGKPIVHAVVTGEPMHAAFARVGVFPASFVDALQLGEESGQIVETMGRLSKSYQEEAETAMKTISMLAGMVVWLLVAGMIILLIFRLFGFYLGTINDALDFAGQRR